jgi:hypothetical protein
VGTTNVYLDTHISYSYINVIAPIIPDTCVGPYSQSFAGGNFGQKLFSQQYVYSLGNIQSPVTFSYNVSVSASRYIITVDNVPHLDTLWLSQPLVDQTMIDTINNALIPYGVPPPALLSASFSNVVQADTNGTGTIYFNKTVPGNITKVNVYNLFDTTCSFTMSCPTPLPPVIPTLPCGGAISPSGNQVLAWFWNGNCRVDFQRLYYPRPIPSYL